ncbi:MAG: hypothetical protein NC102_09785 [Clostridium sp.]|nr:hypothetical protein [Clostridium sp.]
MDDKANGRNNAEFEEYRRQVHGDEDNREEGRSVVPSPSRSVGIAFGIFMIIVYVGVGVLLLINYFGWTSMGWARYALGILLIVYGIFRGYRMFKGSGPYQK